MSISPDSAEAITIGNRHGLRLTCMDIGATWLSCLVPHKGELKEVLLGCATPEQYLACDTYAGAVVGRYANRIAGGRFAVDNMQVDLLTNQSGNTLHGGPDGFDRRRWSFTSRSADRALLELVSPDGDQGFPGEVVARVQYLVTEDNEVVLTFEATSTKCTPLNLCSHAYFNLVNAAGGSDCRDHILQISAERYLPVDEQGIPVSAPSPVDNSPFDFTRARPIGAINSTVSRHQDFDHAFRLSSNDAASLISPDQSLKLEIFSDKPAIQLYTGRWLGGMPNRLGGEYSAYAGVALETQFLPDSPNHPEWDQPDCLFGPEKPYGFTTTYKFTSTG